MKVKNVYEEMRRLFRFIVYILLPLAGGGWVGVSCSDFLYDESDQVMYADDHQLASDADTLWAMAGIMNKMQAIADRTILLGEVRGDLVDLTAQASSHLRQIALFNVSDTNKYNRPRDYYAIINNCNYFLANADTALRNNRGEYIFRKEYAAVKAFRAWTYLQLALNYGRVPFITEPILSMDDSEKQYDLYDIGQVCNYFISDIAPYADIEMPAYNTIRNTDSRLFYFPIRLLMGDLYLWSGQYREAAQSYYQYLATRNGQNSAYPISTSSVRFSRTDTHWTNTTGSWMTSSFQDEKYTSNGELITMIPGDSIPAEGNYSELRDLFNTNENNEYKESITPSQSIIDLSAAQRYCHYTTGGEFVYPPASGLEANKRGDLRLQAVYSSSDNMNIVVNGKRIKNYATVSKYATRNVHLYRRSMVYLRLAEALNRAGYPRMAFQILKRGLNNNVIEQQVVPFYPPKDAAFLRSFRFPNTLYVLETTSQQSNENTMGLHAHGCGFAANDTTYVMPDDATIADSLTRQQYQIEQVEDLIMDEEALEFAFEGHRFYDLMRVALRRNDPSYLARRVYQRRGTAQEGTMHSLIQADLTDTHNWYLPLK